MLPFYQSRVYAIAVQAMPIEIFGPPCKRWLNNMVKRIIGIQTRRLAHSINPHELEEVRTNLGAYGLLLDELPYCSAPGMDQTWLERCYECNAVTFGDRLLLNVNGDLIFTCEKCLNK